MLTQSDIEREQYEARRKAQHDRITDMVIAKQMGAIQAFQRVLGIPESPESELRLRSYDQLNALLNELTKQITVKRD